MRRRLDEARPLEDQSPRKKVVITLKESMGLEQIQRARLLQT
jgi:hypothetical protein